MVDKHLKKVLCRERNKKSDQAEWTDQKWGGGNSKLGLEPHLLFAKNSSSVE